MKTNNTRNFSDKHEKSICRALNAKQVSNSGAGLFKKGDCIQQEASLLIEAKCSMIDKKSVSIKKAWIDKNREEAFLDRLDNCCLCFNFHPEGENFYIIDEKLMKYLILKLAEES